MAAKNKGWMEKIEVEEELINDLGWQAELLNNVIDFTTNTFAVQAILTIIMALTANSALQNMGPYAVNNTTTELIKI